MGCSEVGGEPLAGKGLSPADLGTKVLIFGKDSCPYTAAARKDYEERGYEIEYVDVTKHADGMRMMEQFSGGRDVPVMVENLKTGAKITIGFGGT
ncbi:hypothetical protein MNBD_DELTA01-261 [hydrothermal vent metagenome]|uniref:Glutaredoxin domain-containing protein n=1 Tax=hydrothermal vent metagenome TaxID=652676 RepID=A0A3B0QM60_9ZZZZ